ncbi:MAG: AAA family ATPase [Symploca sp. SIO1B1]|nr:AAA family ATPase [Symploca sp. SIO1C2]NER97412.1 AAA family ATPase [Symploca sp. SIO1B1]
MPSGEISLGERLNSSQLKSFAINGLFGFKDIKINLDKETLILIAENGAGKTTILNILYYSISCQFNKLIYVDFESVFIEFISGIGVEIKKEYLVSSNIHDDRVISNLNRQRLESQEMIFLPTKEYQKYQEKIKKAIERMILNNTEDKKKVIKQNLSESILYFPTYRRIEEDLKNLGYKEDEFEQLSLGDGEGKLIQSGMNDVSDKLDEIKTNIKNSALNLFSKVTGEILTQFVESKPITQEMRNSIKPETLSIVLSRVGEENISSSDREKIEQLVSTGEINSPQHDQLVYFLSKLVSLYEQQKEKDKSINQFVEICNKYLYQKRIIYDEANVEISILQTRDNSPIELKNLSSGEKQIISLFSKIYLESSEDFILLFDEPELSLSLEWQRMLLPDILKSGKCKLLLAATHSPFIFDNELDFNAHDLDTFVQER